MLQAGLGRIPVTEAEVKEPFTDYRLHCRCLRRLAHTQHPKARSLRISNPDITGSVLGQPGGLREPGLPRRAVDETFKASACIHRQLTSQRIKAEDLMSTGHGNNDPADALAPEHIPR